ncbi:unnamed protein product, partial [Rotaria socialis]
MFFLSIKSTIESYLYNGNDNINTTTDNKCLEATGTIEEEVLLVVLDDDDGDDDYEYALLGSPIPQAHVVLNEKPPEQIVSTPVSTAEDSEEKVEIEIKNLLTPLASESKAKLKKTCNPSKISNRSEKLKTQNSEMNSNCTRDKPQRRRKRRLTANSIANNNKDSHTTDNNSASSILSNISFDESPNILTIARMGTIYYCVEDLYAKVFSTLCTFDEYMYLLAKVDGNILKDATLSEKISIEQKDPNLRSLNPSRYHLLAINSFEYLTKLKQLLKKYAKPMDEMIRELSNTKFTPPSGSLVERTTSIPMLAKRNLTNDTDKNHKRVKRFISESQSESRTCFPSDSHDNCNGDSTNETVAFIPRSNSNLEILRKPISVNDQKANRQLQSEQTSNNSLPLNKYQQQNMNWLQAASNASHSIECTSSDTYSMPLIVDVEENVHANAQNIKRTETNSSSSHRQIINHTMLPMPINQSTPSPYSHAHRSSPSCHAPYDPYYRNSYSTLSSSNEKMKELNSSHHDQQSKMISTSYPLSNIHPCSINSNSMSFRRKQNANPILPSAKQVCHLPCCYLPSPCNKTAMPKSISPNEKMTYSNYTTAEAIQSQTVKTPNLPVPTNRKQRQLQSRPYPLLKPAPSRLPTHPQNSFTNEMQTKTNAYHSIPPTVVQNLSTIISPPNTPNGFVSSNARQRNFDIAQALDQHGQSDIDKIPKIVIRHTKTYSNKNVDSMGQLFPTWFREPDYRCIHCFTCDQVFTPQKFIAHVDDEQMANRKPINMTPIQLLPSETLSEFKVGLWNDFCINLSYYTSKLAALKKKEKYDKTIQGISMRQIELLLFMQTTKKTNCITCGTSTEIK